MTAGRGTAWPFPAPSKRLKASDLTLRFCTNETQASRKKFVAKLQRLGFDISVGEVFSPAPAAVAVLRERGLRPHLLVCDGVLPEFDGVETSDPNCVVIGDAAEKFSYANLNEAFRVLIGLEKPTLFSLGKGKYYKETDGLSLDVGVYMKALEYACDVEAEVIGKPSAAFFRSVLNDMALQPHEVMMIGDDLVNDIGGAQQCGMKGVQVRTGKYRVVVQPLLFHSYLLREDVLRSLAATLLIKGPVRGALDILGCYTRFSVRQKDLQVFGYGNVLWHLDLQQNKLELFHILSHCLGLFFRVTLQMKS
ncbi:phospholysine phosphohistidine inorganic pyrophosphate phosphatase isoform X2 [Syngnathoides biaculeatus]|uniref:phospholysine phosphohistidine inorganic pyrophosphate phosphatase isoform X2 n=1 Tax=Syngnathoides biaculeatus TaxID=300417 RepID=UPI002ADE8A1B|nr:phospholysine phosphohistidine inorganic pyrophosphate phosphatase isoform X2 [Syngnathoides biaculeatus]